jgi:hypothetical protein
MEVLRTELPALGKAVETAMKEIGVGSKGGAEGLRDLLHTIGIIIAGTGRFIGWAESAYGALKRFDVGIANTVDHLRDTNGLLWVTLTPAKIAMDIFDPRKPQAFGKSLHDAATDAGTFGDAFGAAMKGFKAGAVESVAGEFDRLGSSISKTAETADTLAGAMAGKIFSNLMSVDQASLGWNESLLAVQESLKKNHKALDIHTEKGIANRRAVLASVQANIDIYKTSIAAGTGATEAAAAYDVNTKALEAQLHKAHFTQAEIDGLIGKYRNVPDEVNTSIIMKGLSEAIAGLDETLRRINGLPTGKTITLHFQTVGSSVLAGAMSVLGAKATGGIRRAATGLVIPPSDPGTVLTGEPQTGGEVLLPLQGISQMRAMSLAQTAGNGYGFDVQPRGAGGGTTTIKLDLWLNGQKQREVLITAATNRGQTVSQYLGV